VALRTVAALLVSAGAISLGLDSAPPSQVALATRAPNKAQSGVQARQIINIRGHEQVLHLYGTPDGNPVVVSSGDGGWIHLAPYVAEFLSSKGFFVIGFDVRAYLESFTSGDTTLRIEDEPGDYRTLIDCAARESGRKPTSSASPRELACRSSPRQIPPTSEPSPASLVLDCPISLSSDGGGGT
jgi:hypothetical protein